MRDINKSNDPPVPRAEPTSPLSAKVALVTGASRGIGRAIALRLASLGAAVAICGRNKSALAGTHQDLEKVSSRVCSQTADVTRSSDIAELVANTESALGPISILVNNAGIGLFGPVQQKTEQEWDHVLNTNLKSVFLVSRAVIPGMISRGSGDIVNISSLAGRNAFAGGALYCASKWGLQGLTACMAEDLREFGIRVSSVLPGSVATDFGQRAKDPGKALAPEDVAHAVAMLLTQSRKSFISEVQLRPLRK
jgi:NAD(P)-dependent dehydrogenase (short-subunit alcohol dehydrogenase family)